MAPCTGYCGNAFWKRLLETPFGNAFCFGLMFFLVDSTLDSTAYQDGLWTHMRNG
jgi:hypothetical protein|eukprot:COSAG06_NODE_112_length_23474_cov_81.804458_11_plen_55_part_00